MASLSLFENEAQVIILKGCTMGAREGERTEAPPAAKALFSVFYVLWQCVECYWPRTPLGS